MDPFTWENHGSFYYDFDGMPITLGRWAVMFEETSDSGERFIATTDVEMPGGGTARVSTIWTGLDAEPWRRDSPPAIYETMVFFTSGDYGSDGFQVRTCTRDEALEVHEVAIEWANALGVTSEHIDRRD